MYKKQWSEFEVQSLAYGILRKNLYPDYLVRGEYKFPVCRVDIAIFKPQDEPKLLCVLEVKKTEGANDDTKQLAKYRELLGVPVILIKGGKDAYNVLELVKPYLNASDGVTRAPK